jgi:nucleoside-diphosphate-sugar epimerase
VSTPEGPRRILLTGGAGFLGAALLRELARPEAERLLHPEEIRVFDRRPTRSDDPRVRPVTGDVRDFDALLEACRGVDCVLHAAGLVDWGRVSEEELRAVNLEGTRNVLRACRETGVPALVHTSTMDVIWGDGPIRRADESHPYPKRFGNAYARTKALAEQEVLKADRSPRAARAEESGGAPLLRTCVLRPCGMYGEADPYHVSEFARVLEARGLPFRIGSGRAVFQHVYVGNVAHAHLLAARALCSPEPAAGGRVYFVTDHPARNFFEFMEPIAEGLGFAMPARSRRLPFPLVYAAGALVEATSRLLRPLWSFTPTLTRTSVRMVCEDFEIASDRAARDLGYAPLFSEEEGVARTVAWFREHGPVGGR